MKKAVSAQRRRGLMWFDQRLATASSPNASGRVSESRADIQCQAQATDNKSLALTPATLTSSGAHGVTTAASVPGRLRGDFSNTQKQAEPMADRTADGLIAGQAARSTGQAQDHTSTAAHTAHARTQHEPRAMGGRIRATRPHARVKGGAGIDGTQTPNPSPNYSQISNPQTIDQQRSTPHRTHK